MVDLLERGMLDLGQLFLEYGVDTDIQIDILNLAKVVKPVSADTFAVTRMFLSGKLEQLRTSREEILVQTLT